MLKKSVSAVISIVLVLTICVTACTSAFAATSRETYISDLVLCSAKSADEAETKLQKQGYKLMATENLNDSLSDGGMYLGYKTTPNRSEAITDVAAMNMTGKYSFSDYEVLMDKMKENVSATIDGLIPMITAYRTNYKAGAATAVSVHDTLNKFYEDDSNTYMGDYLLNCDLKDTTDVTKVFMQGYSAFIVDIQQLLFAAGESENDQKWIEKMAASDEDFLLDLYMDSYPTPNKAYSALAADYGDAADSIRTTWDAFYENLSKVKEKYFAEQDGKLELSDSLKENVINAANQSTEINEDMSAAEVTAVLETNVDSQETYNELADAALITYLNSLEYGDGTMLDFFMRSESDVDDTELYTLVYYMGKDLSAQVNNVGLQQAVSRVLTDGENAKKDDFADVSKTMAAFDKVSIYEGVDRSLFEGGVALTSATTQKNASSEKSWSDDLFSRIFQPETAGAYKWYDFMAFYVLPTVVAVTMLGAMTGVVKALEASYSRYGARTAVNYAMKGQSGLSKLAETTVTLIHDETATIYSETVLKGAANRASTVIFGKGMLVSAKTGGKVLLGIRTFFMAVSVIFTLITLGMAIYTLFSDNVAQSAKYTAIPNHIVDTVSTDNGDDYVAYNYVPNLSGNAGDLNNFVGTEGWLTLYYTKDLSLGEPLTANMKVITGSTKAPLGYENLHLFGEKSALNLTAKDYTGKNDSAKGTYVYFNRGQAAASGSVLTNGNLAIAVGVGAVIGIVIDTMFRKAKSKKKKTATDNQ